MMRSLVNEIVERRLWPIMLVALLVIVAAPLLFLQSAPDGAPAASDAPPPAQPGELPAGAERLVTDSDKKTTPRDDASRSGQDPFAPPTSAVKAAQASTASATQPATKQSSNSATTTSLPTKAVITNPDGSKTTISTKKPGSSTKSTPKAGPKPAPNPTPKPQTTPPATSDPSFASVTVRFAKRQKSRARRSIPRLETFKAGSAVAAMFVKYSPSRKQAVFAIAPTTRVSGDVKCRHVRGVCRYVDIPEGKHARLTVWTPKGRIIKRRLDVVSIRTAAEVAASNVPAPATRPTRTTLGEAKCLVRFLLALPSIFPSIPADTCQ